MLPSERLDEQVALGSGADFWTTKAIGDVPAITLTDGPHGVRRQSADSDAMGIYDSEPATCFPPAAGLAASWDPELVERVGAAIGAEAQALDVQVVLGRVSTSSGIRAAAATSSTTPRILC